MSRFDKRFLPASIFIAALVGTCSLAIAQSPIPAPSVSPEPTTAAQTIINQSPRPQPTPEQLGDALMAHQRYQAAIEAYKKAPTDNPVCLE